MPDFLKPSALWRALDDIDQTPLSHTLDRQRTLRRLISVMVIASISLLLVEYLKHSRVLRQFINLLEQNELLPSGYDSIMASPFYSLYIYVWWTLWQFIAYILVPLIGVKLVLKGRFRDYGWRWDNTTPHLGGYALLLTPMVIGVIAVSFTDSFSSFYPFYNYADRSWLDLLAWECLYIFQFVCVEFFFRGFLLQALRPAIGASAILVMCVPYMMIHFTKPMFESGVAFVFGIFLGILSLRSGSIWGGVIVHVVIAVSMDMMALIQRGRLPDTFWPLFQ